MTNIKLGSKVRDTITGYTGIAICESTWLNGCVRVTVQGQSLKDGKAVDSETFDIQQIEVMKQDAVKLFNNRKTEKEPGGPTPEPRLARDPK